ncbi:MAG TPA: glycosyltransferase family 4 protein [Gemmatimonadales bacterium]|nr:glycosyltransferase family 4 protein [Gemmatimonadales bacterium]
MNQTSLAIPLQGSPGSVAATEAPLTIAVVAACPFPAPRGTPIRILRLAEAVAARGHRVHVVAYHHGLGEVDPSVILHRIAPVAGYDDLRPGPSLRKLVRLDPALTSVLAGLLRGGRVDLIHAHHFEGLLVGRAARAMSRSSAPLVFDAHTLLTSELPSYGLGLPSWVKRLAGTLGDRWLPPLADHVASCTERIRARLIEIGALSPDEVTVVPNGVEPERFDARPLPRSEGDHPHLIFTGNLARYQGVDLMLDAFRLVLDHRPEARLTIATAGSFAEHEGRARELRVRDAIDLVPATVEDEAELLRGADVALNPRVDCDGIPMKLLNYMAAARPVVSFRGSAPGLRHRDTAWLAEDGDVRAFATGILAVLDQPLLARGLGERARRFVQDNHTWDQSAELAVGMYRQTMAMRGFVRIR